MLNHSDRGGKWIESDAADFQPVYATWFDHPVPAGISMAEFGLSRVALLTGSELHFKEYLQPFQSDFYNITAMISNGLFHIITSPEPVDWKQLAANSIQTRGSIHSGLFYGNLHYSFILNFLPYPALYKMSYFCNLLL